MNRYLESDLDAPRIIYLVLNLAQHDNQENHLSLPVEVAGKPFYVLVDSGVQGFFISERLLLKHSPNLEPTLADTLSTCLIELHDVLMDANGHITVEDHTRIDLYKTLAL